MSNIEDYPGPTDDQPEKQGMDGPANEEIVKPPVVPDEEEGQPESEVNGD